MQQALAENEARSEELIGYGVYFVRSLAQWAIRWKLRLTNGKGEVKNDGTAMGFMRRNSVQIK